MIPKKLVEACKKKMERFDCEGFVYGTGPIRPVLFFVGEAPGETEIHNGIPFSGRAGEEFEKFITYLDLTRADIYITSAIRSRPYKWRKPPHKTEKRKYNRTPNQKEIAAHAPLLDYEIEKAEPNIIVPMGRIAYWRLLGEHPRMDEVTGTFITSPIRKLDDWEKNTYRFTEKTYTLFPMYHPAAVLYKRSLESVIYEHLDKLKEFLSKDL